MIIDNSRMERSLKHLLVKEHFPHGRIAFVVGPRQVGKTTLARELLAARGSADLYRNWDDLDWRRALVRDPYGFVDAYRTRDGKPWVLVEVKISDTDPGPHMRFFAARLGVKHAFLVVRDLKEPGTAGDVHVLDAASFLGALPV
jgi:hypothetical protein